MAPRNEAINGCCQASKLQILLFFFLKYSSFIPTWLHARLKGFDIEQDTLNFLFC